MGSGKESNGAEDGICKKNQSAFADRFFQLALFLEAGAAASAVDGDLALAPGNPQILTAAGALEIDMVLVPMDGAAKAPPADDGIRFFQELCVFLPAFVDISGEHAKQRQKNHNSTQETKNRNAGDSFQEPQTNI